MLGSTFNFNRLFPVLGVGFFWLMNFMFVDKKRKNVMLINSV